MTTGAIAGLVALNLFILAVGCGVLVGIRGRCPFRDLAQLAGVAYFLGVSLLFVAFSLELALGVPFEPLTVVITGIALGVGSAVIGVRRTNVQPVLNELGLGRRHAAGAIAAGAAIALIAVYLMSLFRAGRLSSLGWDVWASWVPKAQSIYLRGRVDADFFASLPGASYPPGIPALNSIAFSAMGSMDYVTLHLQYWFFAAGFVAAVVGLLWREVRPVILLPVALAMLLMPDLRNRAVDLYGDVPLGYLVALSALLMLLWIRDAMAWRLAALSLLLAGAMLTKREGILFVACIAVSGLVATLGDRRRAWPRIGLAVIVSFVLALPWRIWFTVNDLPSDAPESGYLGVLSHLDRAWPSIELVVRVFFDYDLWLLIPTLGIAAALLALAAGARKEAAFALVLLGTSLIGCAWTFWSNPSLDIGTEEGLVNRVVGTPTLVIATLSPLLLQLAWASRPARSPSESGEPRHSRARMLGVAALAALAVVAYPVIVLAGGAPSFPAATDCVHTPEDGKAVRVVFGYADNFGDAIKLRDRALEVGFEGTDAAQDGCGRVRVYLDDVPSVATGQEIVDEAFSVDLRPTLELDSDG